MTCVNALDGAREELRDWATRSIALSGVSAASHSQAAATGTTAHPLPRPRPGARLPLQMARDILRVLRMWRLLVSRSPPSSDSDDSLRWINGELATRRYLWEAGVLTYQTALIDCVWAWRRTAGWRADWRGVSELGGMSEGRLKRLWVRSIRITGGGFLVHPDGRDSRSIPAAHIGSPSVSIILVCPASSPASTK
ncbi:hypothetical protein N9L68_04525 [bacterium]|nr:hypothetical protein [bacterium]